MDPCVVCGFVPEKGTEQRCSECGATMCPLCWLSYDTCSEACDKSAERKNKK